MPWWVSTMCYLSFSNQRSEIHRPLFLVCIDCTEVFILEREILMILSVCRRQKVHSLVKCWSKAVFRMSHHDHNRNLQKNVWGYHVGIYNLIQQRARSGPLNWNSKLLHAGKAKISIAFATYLVLLQTQIRLISNVLSRQNGKLYKVC